MKKLVALVLALALCLSLCTVTAFAASSPHLYLKWDEQGTIQYVITREDGTSSQTFNNLNSGDKICPTSSVQSVEINKNKLIITLVDAVTYTIEAKANDGYTFDKWEVEGDYKNKEETTYTAKFKEDKGISNKLLIAAGITVVAVGTIHTVKAIKNYKAEKAAAAEAAKLAEMPMVRMGDSCDAVMTLQTELNAQGYACGEADGVFGQNTLNAVIAFQTAKGLTADGVVGAQTWEALL